MYRTAAVLPFVLLVALSLPAQTTDTIDLRGHDANPSKAGSELHCGRGGGIGGAMFDGPNLANRLHATLTVTNPGGLFIDEPFDYELLVTNGSTKNVSIPRSLEPEDVEQSAHTVHTYRRGAVSFALQLTPQSSTSFYQDVYLYGDPSKPYTMLTLKPGDSVRILGTARLDPSRVSQPESGEMHGGLYGTLGIGNAGVERANRPGCRYGSFFFGDGPNIRSDVAVPVMIHWR